MGKVSGGQKTQIAVLNNLKVNQELNVIQWERQKKYKHKLQERQTSTITYCSPATHLKDAQCMGEGRNVARGITLEQYAKV